MTLCEVCRKQFISLAYAKACDECRIHRIETERKRLHVTLGQPRAAFAEPEPDVSDEDMDYVRESLGIRTSEPGTTPRPI